MALQVAVVHRITFHVTGIRQGQNIDYEKLSVRISPSHTSRYRPLPGPRRPAHPALHQRQAQAQLEEEKQAIINQAVTRGLDPNVPLKPSGVEWLGDVPEHWERRRLKTILQPVDRRPTSGGETLLSLRRDYGVYAEHFVRPSQSRSLVGFKLVSVGQLVFSRHRSVQAQVQPKRDGSTRSCKSSHLSQYQAVDPGDVVLNNQQADLARFRGSGSNLEGIVSPAYPTLSIGR